MPGELTILGAITEKWTNYEPYYIHFFSYISNMLFNM